MSTWDATSDPDDERPADPGDEEGALTLPDRLDAPLDAPEADVVDQVIEVPTGDDDE